MFERVEQGQQWTDVSVKLMKIEKNALLDRAVKEMLTGNEQNRMKKLQPRRRQSKMLWDALSPDDKVLLRLLHQLAEAGVHRKAELLCQRPELPSASVNLSVGICRYEKKWAPYL